MSQVFSIVLYEGRADLTSVTGRDSHHLRVLGSVSAVAFAPNAAGDLANASPLAIVCGEKGENRRVALSWAAFPRHLEVDPPVHAAPFTPPLYIDQGGHVLEIQAGDLVIPAAK